jgi:hypothetical protein
MRPALFLALAALAPAFAATRVAYATPPTVADCLSATESSLKLMRDDKLQAARTDLLVCSAKSCPAVIRKECLQRIDTVNAAIPTVVFTAKSGDGRALTAVKVTMDGAVVASQLDGTALSLDPGIHHFTFEVADQLPVSEDLVLHSGEKNRAESLVIGPAAVAPVVTAPVTTIPVAHAPARVDPAPVPVAHDAEDGGHGRRVAAVVVGVAGVVGLALGGVFGGLTISEWNEATKACPTHPVGCSSPAIGMGGEASTYGNVSTASFITGGVLAAAGVTLYFTAPKPGGTSVGLSVGPSALGVNWAF